MNYDSFWEPVRLRSGGSALLFVQKIRLEAKRRMVLALQYLRPSIPPGTLILGSFLSSTVGRGFCKVPMIFLSALSSVCVGVNSVDLFDELPQTPSSIMLVNI